MKEQQFEYDIQKRAKAGTAATLRAVISVYVIYLGWTVLKGVLNGSSPVPVWVGQLPGSGLGRLAGGDCIYCGGDCLWRVYMENLAS